MHLEVSGDDQDIVRQERNTVSRVWAGLVTGIRSDFEEFRNSHGGADAGAGTGTSYLCDSNCDMFNLTQ